MQKRISCAGISRDFQLNSKNGHAFQCNFTKDICVKINPLCLQFLNVQTQKNATYNIKISCILYI